MKQEWCSELREEETQSVYRQCIIMVEVTALALVITSLVPWRGLGKRLYMITTVPLQDKLTNISVKW